MSLGPLAWASPRWTREGLGRDAGSHGGAGLERPRARPDRPNDLRLISDHGSTCSSSPRRHARSREAGASPRSAAEAPEGAPRPEGCELEAGRPRLAGSSKTDGPASRFSFPLEIPETVLIDRVIARGEWKKQGHYITRPGLLAVGGIGGGWSNSTGVLLDRPARSRAIVSELALVPALTQTADPDTTDSPVAILGSSAVSVPLFFTSHPPPNDYDLVKLGHFVLKFNGAMVFLFEF